MRRWETLAALAAVIAASIGALRVPGRWWFTLVAIVLLAVVGAARLAAALGRSQTPRSDAAERAERIRRQRRRR
jgi:membrane protein implicated in regulation of membrane protease activity